MQRVRRVFELFRSDWEPGAERDLGERQLAATAELFHPDFELDTTRAPTPDLRGKFQGPAVMGAWREWLEAWESLEFEVDLIDAGDHVLAALTRQTMRGRASGVEVELGAYWQLFSFRDGRVIRQVLFFDESEALQAAGLSE